MSMELRAHGQHALLVPTSMGVRLTPKHGQPFHTASEFALQVTSAETNVASVSSFLGLPVKVLTNFVQGSPISQLIKDNLAGRHMDVEGPELEQGWSLGLSPSIQLWPTVVPGRAWTARAQRSGRRSGAGTAC